MREKIDPILKHLKEIANKIDRKKRKWIVGGAAALLVIAVGGAVLINHKPMAVLFSGLNQEEVTEVVGKIQEQGVTASFDKNGDVLAPSDQVDSLRAKLAMGGYPRSGLSYDVFSSNLSMMSTEFEKQSYKLFDLQDRIAATLRWFDGVKDAVVNIDPGDDNKYVLDKDKKNPTAAVTVNMKGGGSLTDEQAEAIRHLVAKSVSGLKEEDVAISDTSGKSYTMGASNETDSAAKLKMNLESQIDSTLQQKIIYLLSPICGEDNVRVTVNSKVDVNKRVSEITNYSPYTSGAAVGIPSKTTRNSEVTGAGQTQAGSPGTDTNAQVPQYPNVNFNGNNINSKNSESSDYLVDQMKEQIMNNGGELQDLTVTVIMDAKDITGGQMDQIRTAVANAAGISPDIAPAKVVVLNQRFNGKSGAVAAGSKLLQAVSDSRMWIIGAAAALLLLGLVAMLVRHGAKKKKKKESGLEALPVNPGGVPMGEGLPQSDLPPAEEFNLHLEGLKHTREMELKEQIQDFAQQNPEISAQLIKTWLKGGEGGGE